MTVACIYANAGGQSAVLDAAGDAVVQAISGATSLGVNVAGAFVGTVRFEATVDNETWTDLELIPEAGGGAVSSVEAGGSYAAPVGALAAIRCTFARRVSGAPTVTLSTRAPVVLPASPLPGLFNFDPLHLPTIRAKLMDVRSGRGRARIAMLGDSTTAGYGAGTGGTVHRDGGRNRSVPFFLAKFLSAAGLSAGSDAWFGEGACGVLGDTRVVYGSGWGLGAWYGMGGLPAVQGTTTGAAYALTPDAPVDTIDVWYADNAKGSAFTVDCEGSEAVSATIGATHTIKKVSLGVPVGSHTFNIRATSLSGGPVTIFAVDCYNASGPHVSIWNWGIGGATGVTFTQTMSVYSPANSFSAYAPDLTIINLGINDETLSVSYTDYITRIANIVARARASGDVMLTFHHDVNHRAATAQEATLSALSNLAEANAIPLINVRSRLGTWAAANGRGLMYDAAHCLAAGYEEQARLIADAILLL